MEFLTVREFTSSLRDSRGKLERYGKLVLTNNGKPMALMIKIGQTNFEEILKLAQQIEKIQSDEKYKEQLAYKTTPEEKKAAVDHIIGALAGYEVDLDKEREERISNK
jgi:hypothetical protein